MRNWFEHAGVDPKGVEVDVEEEVVLEVEEKRDGKNVYHFLHAV